MMTLALAAGLFAAEPPTPWFRNEDREVSGPRRRASVFNGVAGTLTLLGAGLHIGGLVGMQTTGDRQPNLGLIWGGTFVHAHALVGAALGSNMAGRARALEDQGPPPKWKRPAVGWPLFAAGLAVFVASRAVPMACFTTQCALITAEVGYVAGLTSMMVGLHAVGAWHGYRSQQRLSLAPRADFRGGQTSMGLTLSGRF